MHEALPVEALAGSQEQMHHVAAVVALALHDVRLRPDHLLGRSKPDGHAEDLAFDRMLEPFVVDRGLTVATREDEIDECIAFVDLSEPVWKLELGVISRAIHHFFEARVVASADEHVEVFRLAGDAGVTEVRVSAADEERQALGMEELERGAIEIGLITIDLRDLAAPLELESSVSRHRLSSRG
jgi:hypothetical protein